MEMDAELSVTLPTPTREEQKVEDKRQAVIMERKKQGPSLHILPFSALCLIQQR